MSITGIIVQQRRVLRERYSFTITCGAQSSPNCAGSIFLGDYDCRPEGANAAVAQVVDVLRQNYAWVQRGDDGWVCRPCGSVVCGDDE